MADQSKTLRLLMPQWQGGNNPAYYLGARLLAWLAPQSNAQFAEVPVSVPNGAALEIEDGVVAKTAILDQTRAALDIIRAAAPDKIVTFGGDCSVSLAPFSYLSAKYADDIALLWIDSHADIASSERYQNAHGYPVRNLLGKGDAEFAAFVERPIPGNRLLYVGLGKDRMSEWAKKDLDSWGTTAFAPSELTDDFHEVIDWIRACGASKLLVHFDLDALDPDLFRAQLFTSLEPLAPHFRGMATGKMSFSQVTDLLARSGEVADIVALSITEHLPWDALALQKAMERLPLLS